MFKEGTQTSASKSSTYKIHNRDEELHVRDEADSKVKKYALNA